MSSAPRRSSALRGVISSLFLASTLLLGACSTPTGATPQPSASPTEVLAKIGSVSITLKDVDTKASGELRKIKKEEFEARRRALDTLIDEKLVELEAQAQGISVQELVQKEVASKTADPTEDEMRMVFEMNRGRIGETPYEEVAPRIREFLMGRKQEEARINFLTSLRAKYSVEDNFQPPRQQVSVDDDAMKGNKDAAVTIVTFSDYQCPFCTRAEAVVDEVMKKYDGKVKLIFRDFPLEFHNNAKGAAQASECAEEQGKFWEMHKAMFADQNKLDKDSLVATAGTIGLNTESFKSCLESGKYAAEVDKDMAEGKEYGVTGTPAFFINGIMIEGAQPLEEFSRVIDAELKRLGK